LSLLIEALQQAGVSLPVNVLGRSLHLLKHRGPALLLRWYERLPAAVKELEAVQKQVQYLCKRLPLMQYPRFQRQGWPLGSGMVESANKLVVQARLKGAGRHWESAHVNPMVAQRAAVCSERWDEAWQDTIQEQRSQRATRRKRRSTTRVKSQLASLLRLLLRLSPSPSKPEPVLPAATLPGSCRPSAIHPWKRTPACRPKPGAKK